MDKQNIPTDVEKQMRKTGIKIALIMALLMSFGLSLTGNLMAERPPETPLMATIIGFFGSLDKVRGFMSPMRADKGLVPGEFFLLSFP